MVMKRYRNVVLTFMNNNVNTYALPTKIGGGTNNKLKK